MPRIRSQDKILIQWEIAAAYRTVTGYIERMHYVFELRDNGKLYYRWFDLKTWREWSTVNLNLPWDFERRRPEHQILLMNRAFEQGLILKNIAQKVKVIYIKEFKKKEEKRAAFVL